MEHGPKKCDAPTIQESDLQDAVVKAINLTLGNRDSMMDVLQENIEAVIRQEEETSAEGINAKLEELQKELLRLANSKKDYNSVADEIDRLRELKQEALTESAEREGVKKRIKKDLWKNVKPVIKKYANDSGEDLTTIDIVEDLLEEINELDKNGDNFRYPTSYSLEYRFDNKELDISNVYTYLKAIINFLDGCDSMLDAIADYQSEIKAEYEAEMRASLDWY